MLTMYVWVGEFPHDLIQRETKLSKNTVTQLNVFCREVLVFGNAEFPLLGGWSTALMKTNKTALGAAKLQYRKTAAQRRVVWFQTTVEVKENTERPGLRRVVVPS